MFWMAFNISGRNKITVSSTIELFNKLGKLDRLSLQQGQSLEEYERINQNNSDIAIEMPAGHGKTLVGGLIGEFNRISKQRRVVYCCATRQLATQTSRLLESYGIKSVVLTGKKRDFSEREIREYRRAAAIAVTTYSHIFNTNPEFSDAELIIFDDAHATEYAINDFWTLEINKFNDNQESIFNSFYSILKEIIPKQVQDKIDFGTYDPMYDGVDIIPQPLWIDRADEIRSFLDNATKDTSLYFSWSKLRNILSGCQIYITHNKMSIKPIIPPNKLHLPFMQANERIYMSATLGPVGELERIFGIKNIERISKFSKGANKVSGRRLILFPEDHFEKEKILEVITETIKLQPRTLMLFPSNDLIKSFKEYLEKKLPEYKIYLSEDIEDSLESFKHNNKAILLLAGRYEGIDLKDSECRLQIFFDLPTAVGVSEQFLQTRLRASEILKNRLATRLIQGLGRCTRGTKDYAAVLFIGKRVGEYIYKNDFRELLPSEIAAEIEFGFDQIDTIKDMDSWKESLEIFFEQEKEWEEVENYIKQNTDSKQKAFERLTIDGSIEKCALHEVDFQYNLIEGDYEQSRKEINELMKLLGRKPLLKGYRAWWNYNIACVSKQQGDIETTKEFLTKAISASTNKLWLDKKNLDLNLPEHEDFDEVIEEQIQNIMSNLLKYGDRDQKFEKDWNSVINGLKAKDAKLFEPALKKIGTFLGMKKSTRPEGKGTPDSVWEFLDQWVVFEAKTNIKDETKEIPLDDIRQAGFHKSWLLENENCKPTDKITVCIICEKNFIEEYAKHAAKNIYLVAPLDLLSKVQIFGDILRTTIQKIIYSTEDDARKYLLREIISKKLIINDFISWLKSNELNNLIR
ncbi:hypothetical protein CFN60_13990 [Bacillus velezensis]|nr:hypothetical protein CFN60_13990 [Bacillus velezensis]ATV23802.1 hypothetical protein CS547_14050 [Bacillus sp. Lzh-5]MVZ93001.1 hypothetical protein [Bacillus velezensis]